MKISIETKVNGSLESIWKAWTSPEDITQWNFATEEWCCPNARIDLKPDGNFSYRMEAKDGSMGFDFNGIFLAVEPYKRIEFHLGDDRSVEVEFIKDTDGILVRETFEAENENSAEQQKQGWQAILNNFKKYVESKTE